VLRQGEEQELGQEQVVGQGQGLRGVQLVRGLGVVQQVRGLDVVQQELVLVLHGGREQVLPGGRAQVQAQELQPAVELGLVLGQVLAFYFCCYFYFCSCCSSQFQPNIQNRCWRKQRWHQVLSPPLRR